MYHSNYKMEIFSCQSSYPRICPFPKITYFFVVRASCLIGPRAWSFWVLIPISAPNPNSLPSVNLVDALTYTAFCRQCQNEIRYNVLIHFMHITHLASSFLPLACYLVTFCYISQIFAQMSIIFLIYLHIFCLIFSYPSFFLLLPFRFYTLLCIFYVYF